MRYLISLLISNLLIFQPAFATLNDVEKAQAKVTNLLPNPGIQNGKAGFTLTGTGASLSTDTTVSGTGFGDTYLEWDSDGADQVLSMCGTLKEIHKSANGAGAWSIAVPSGAATTTITVTDGSNPLVTATTITNSTTATYTSVNPQFPSSGSVCLVLTSVAANEPAIRIYHGFLGLAKDWNVSSVSQATFVGGMENAGSGATCNYSQNTSSGISDFDDLGAGTSCAAWTVVSNGPGTISAQGTNDHRLVYTNMPPGNYQFIVSGIMGNGSAANATVFFQLSDGTNSYQAQGIGASAQALNTNIFVFHVTVTTSATRTYKIQCSDNAAITCAWFNSANNPGSWKVYRFPTSSEQAYTPDLQAMSWSGYHDNTCSWARTNTAIGDPTADASCALTQLTNQNFGTVSTTGSVLPGITFTPKKAGRYFVCAGLSSIYGSAVSTVKAHLLDDSTVIAQQAFSSAAASYIGNMHLCGVVVATSTASKTLKIQTAVDSGTVTMTVTSPNTYAITWNIVSIDQSLPAPVLTNMVTSGSSGGVKIVSASLNCDASSAVTSSEAGFTSLAIGNIASGSCAITWASTIWTAAPRCFITATTISGGGDSYILGFTAAPTTTGVTIHGTYDDSTNVTTADFDLLCIGAR